MDNVEISFGILLSPPPLSLLQLLDSEVLTPTTTFEESSITYRSLSSIDKKILIPLHSPLPLVNSHLHDLCMYLSIALCVDHHSNRETGTAMYYPPPFNAYRICDVVTCVIIFTLKRIFGC